MKREECSEMRIFRGLEQLLLRLGIFRGSEYSEPGIIRDLEQKTANI